MLPHGHIAYPFLAVYIANWLFGLHITAKHYLILVFFSIVPDLDFLLYRLLPWKKKKYGERWFDKEHHKWASHWPLAYLFLFVIYVINRSSIVLMMIIGVYSHFILDSFLSGDGIMWLFPFSRKYLNLISSKTKGFMGMEWVKRYRKTLMFKFDVIAFLVSIFILIFRI
ncbi:metal-dependent hydrolase [Candidatus Woesearchaeota archaeon]|nr:metal-dependent hydrolase [Candidatus Woesearchaeota archaeon]